MGKSIKLILLALCAWLLVSCKHPNPGPHVSNNPSTEASWDGVTQNSGVISLWPQNARGSAVQGFRVTTGFRARHNALIAKYGRRFTPPIVPDQGMTPFPDDTWLISQQAMVWFMDMNQWQRNGVPPS